MHILSHLCTQHSVVDTSFADHADYLRSMPEIFEGKEGDIIHDRRNQLRRLTHGGHTYVVKSFQRPHLLNQIIYGTFRRSKARRSYEYAQLLRSQGFASPQPVAYVEESLLGILFRRSYYVSLQSTLRYTYQDIIDQRFDAPTTECYLRAIAAFTARLHNAGMIHRDYSRGNLLLDTDAEGRVLIQLIDLNRIRFRPVTTTEGLANLFERLPVSPDQRRLMTEVYESLRG